MKPWVVSCPKCKEDIRLSDQDWTDDFVTEGYHDFSCPHCLYDGQIEVECQYYHEFLLSEEDDE